MLGSYVRGMSLVARVHYDTDTPKSMCAHCVPRHLSFYKTNLFKTIFEIRGLNMKV